MTHSNSKHMNDVLPRIQAVEAPILGGAEAIDMAHQRRHQFDRRNSIAYAQAMHAQAMTWAAYLTQDLGVPAQQAYSEAFSGLEFCFEHRPKAFSLPAKLINVAGNRTVLRALQAARYRGLKLDAHIELINGVARVKLYYERLYIGRLPQRHVAWFRNLMAHGAGVYLTRIAGAEDPRETLEVEVAIGFASQAIDRKRESSFYAHAA